SLGEQGIDREQVTTFLQFLKQLQERITGWITKMLDDSGHPATNEWRNSVHQSLPEELSTGLREADSPGQPDWLTQWTQGDGTHSQLEAAAEIGGGIATAIEQANERHGQYTHLKTYTDTVGTALTRWQDRDHTQYFRELKLERRDEPYTDADFAWQRHYRANLVLNNCIPADEIADQLAQFGGGVLMSATLAPLDVFRETTGLSRLKEHGRHIRELTYGLSFPETNRESLVTDLPPFTS